MNIEEIHADKTIVSLLFHDKKKELIDIDQIFIKTNANFAILMDRLNLPTTFDFSKRDNQKFYMHEFLKTFCEFLKSRSSDYRPFFYSNTLTKDKFRNLLIKKIKSIFGFSIWEENVVLSVFSKSIMENDCNCFQFFMFLDNPPPMKRFKHIKKYLHNVGLVEMKDSYLEELSNKIILYS